MTRTVANIHPSLEVVPPKGRDRLEQKIGGQLEFIPDLGVRDLVRDLKDVFRGYITLEHTETNDSVEAIRPYLFQLKLKVGERLYCALYLCLNVGDLSFELQVIPPSILRDRKRAHDWYFLLRHPTLENLSDFLDKKCKGDA